LHAHILITLAGGQADLKLAPDKGSDVNVF
jgi:hypothetical protein